MLAGNVSRECTEQAIDECNQLTPSFTESDIDKFCKYVTNNYTVYFCCTFTICFTSGSRLLLLHFTLPNTAFSAVPRRQIVARGGDILSPDDICLSSVWTRL